MWEFTRAPRVSSWLALEAPAVSYGKSTPYDPIIALLQSYFKIEAGDDAPRIRAKVTAACRARSPLHWAVPALSR